MREPMCESFPSFRRNKVYALESPAIAGDLCLS